MSDPDFLEKMIAAIKAFLMLTEPFQRMRALSASLSLNMFSFTC